MDYKKIVINALVEKRNQNTPYLTYFQREAEFYLKIKFVEKVDFFEGCVFVLSEYKQEIVNQYLKCISENTNLLNLYNNRLKKGEINDSNGVSIISHIEYIENEINRIRELGYERNRDYKCVLTKNGLISNDFFDTYFTIFYDEILEIEKIIKMLQANVSRKKVTTLNEKTEKVFEDYLHHKNKNALMKKLHELLDNSKGKNVAFTIAALEQLNFIGGYSTKNELYNLMRFKFGEIGSKQSINKYLSGTIKEQFKNEINSLVSILQEV